jgi:hypothetical protein
MSVKLAANDRPIAGSNTATMFESSIIREETSEAVRSTADLVPMVGLWSRC